MTHFLCIRRSKSDRFLPFLLCRQHLDALPAEHQAKYAACNAPDCGCTDADCYQCDDWEAGDA